MDEATEAFLAAHPAHYEGRDDWPLDPVAPLRVRLCLAATLPPPALRSSVTAIVAHEEGSVLFLQPGTPTGTIAHVIVGGRPEHDEAPEETLRREVAEETGWLVEPAAIVGFRHFEHLGPPHPVLADRPYPDFLQPVYAAIATAHDPGLLPPDETPSDFVDAKWALDDTEVTQRPLLVAALRAVGLGP